MGYQAEKNKIEGKKRTLKIVFACVLSVIVCGLIIFSFFVPPNTWKYHVRKPDVAKRGEGELRMHFIDVGQGDSTLIELPDGKVMLIDGGDGRNDATSAILRYLNALDIDTIDYLVATHADEDHCGGLERIVKQKTILNAYLPPIKAEKAGGTYASFFSELLKEDCTWEYASRRVILDGKGEYPYTLSFLYPYLRSEAEMEEAKADNNALSSVIWLDYQGVSALFTGDAPSATEEVLMRDDGELGVLKDRGVDLKSTEILKVAHHGSADSTSLRFLNYLQVETAVISCGKNNSYGHPSDQVQRNLQSAEVDCYRTDENGTVMITVFKNGEYTVN